MVLKFKGKVHVFVLGVFWVEVFVGGNLDARFWTLDTRHNQPKGQ